MRKDNRVHREWFRSIVKTTCSCGAKKTQVFSWGEYICGKWRTVDYVCEACFKPSVLPRLKAHMGECGCSFELVGKGSQLPPWLTMGEMKECAA